jgi:glucose-6-phosphate dehydrogenase assembly protein OpcA
VASAIRSLTVGGLPVVVLAETVSPLALDWVSALGSTPDLILGDSAGLEGAAAEAWWTRCGKRGTRCRDLQWARLLDWRRAVALWFDRPGAAASLSALARVRVEVPADTGSRQKARLFLGWLGSRLGWERDSLRDGENGPCIHAPGGSVDLEVREVASRGDPASILALELAFRSSWPPVTWRRLAAERAILIEDAKGARLRLNQTRTGRAEAVVAMIHEHVPDPVAPPALDYARAFGGIR